MQVSALGRPPRGKAKAAAGTKTAVFIVCRDRLSPLESLVTWLERHGHERIILIDNASTYAPLLDYLDRSPHVTLRQAENIGPYESVWGRGLIDRYARGDYFVVTDCDVVPDEGCPGDAIDFFRWVLCRFPEPVKAGFALRIDDLPRRYALADRVRQWESQYWRRPFAANLYRARIDTTFALYRPDAPFTYGPAVRTGAPYIARHLPWYADSAMPTEEERYFREHCRHDISHWDLAGQPEPDDLPPWSLLDRLRWQGHAALRMPRDPTVPRRYRPHWDRSTGHG